MTCNRQDPERDNASNLSSSDTNDDEVEEKEVGVLKSRVSQLEEEIRGLQERRELENQEAAEQWANKKAGLEKVIKELQSKEKNQADREEENAEEIQQKIGNLETELREMQDQYTRESVEMSKAVRRRLAELEAGIGSIQQRQENQSDNINENQDRNEEEITELGKKKLGENAFQSINQNDEDVTGKVLALREEAVSLRNEGSYIESSILTALRKAIPYNVKRVIDPRSKLKLDEFLRRIENNYKGLSAVIEEQNKVIHFQVDGAKSITSELVRFIQQVELLNVTCREYGKEYEGKTWSRDRIFNHILVLLRDNREFCGSSLLNGIV